MSNSFNNLLARLYQKRRDKLIGNGYYFLNSLNSITPSVINLEEVKKVLVLAPHPDDEAIGCGGTLKRLTGNGCRGETIFFTNGRTGETDERCEITKTRKNEALLSAKELGITNCHFLDFYDGRLKPDKISVNFLLSRLNDLKPDLVFTPFFMDNHSDHRATAKILALAANRHNGDFLCCCYELWSTLIPNYIVDITPFMERKISAIKIHESQTAETDFVDLAKGLNRYRAIVSGQSFKYAEAFFVVSKKQYIKISKQL